MSMFYSSIDSKPLHLSPTNEFIFVHSSQIFIPVIVETLCSLPWDMDEYITLHRGHIVLAKCHLTEKHKTTLLINVFQYKSYSKTFDNVNTISVPLKGKWTIVGLKNVENKRTNIICPCIGLFCQKSSGAKVFTIENLEKCVEELQQTISLSSLVDTKRPDGLHWFIGHGPKLVCVDHENSILVVVDSCAGAEKMVNLSIPKLMSRPFLVNQSNDSKNELMTFIGVSSEKPNLRIAGMQYVFQEPEKNLSGNLFGCSWVSFDICYGFAEATNENKEKSDVYLQNKPLKPDIPTAYCSVTTAVYQWQENQEMTILATQYPQLVVICNGDVVKCCDLPPCFVCDSISMTDDHECRVVLAVDSKNKTCCAINYTTFQITRSWQNVVSVCKGAMLFHGNIFDSIFLLHSSDLTDMIQPEQYNVICGIEDVETCQSLADEQDAADEHMKENHIDEMEDLFMASPPQQEETEKNNSAAKRKVADCLEATQKKLWAEMNEQKLLVKKKHQVLERSTTAIRHMNNHIDLSNASTPKQVETEELVDLFSGEPVYIQDNKKHEKYLDMLGTWQNIISDRWIVGFRLKNISDRKFVNFAVMLTPHQETNLEPVMDTTLRTNMYKIEDLTKCTPTTHSGLKMTKTKLSSSQIDKAYIHNCAPQEEVLITAIGELPRFAASQPKMTFSATLFAREATGPISKAFVFDLGKVSISASEVARGVLLSRSEDLLSSSSACDRFTQSVASLKSYSSTRSNLVATSEANDVLSIIEVLLRQLGFKLIDDMGAFVCMEMTSLHYVFVKLRAITRRNVKLKVHSRSELGCNLLLSFFKEQVPHDFCITPEHKTSQEENTQDLLPLTSLSLADKTTLPSKRFKINSSGSSDCLQQDAALNAIRNQLLVNEQMINALQS